MQWESDVTAGEWITERLVDDQSLHRYVPQGFEAYARVLHPAFRERPIGAEWPPEGDPEAWANFSHDIESEQARWAEAATALGTHVDARSEWDAVAGARRDAEGWRYEDPNMGTLDPASLSALATILMDHTSTPDDGFASVWDGWGGLVGFVGSRPSRAGLAAAYSDAPAENVRHRSMLRESFRDIAFRRKGWNPGVLSDDISRGPRLETLTRSHVLFRAAPRTWTDPLWPGTVPWREGGEAYSPSLAWPADRAWILVTDPEAHSTVVGGSAQLIAALAEDPSVEALRVDPTDPDWAL